MNEEKIDRKELDHFSASILINLGLINVAALAAAVTYEVSVTPYSIGLLSALLSQLLWYGDSAFTYDYTEAKDPINKKIGLFVEIAILYFAFTSAVSIFFGCLNLLVNSVCLSLIIAIVLGYGPLALLIYAYIREDAFRSKNS